MPSLDEYIEEIRPIWQSHWLTNMGAKHQQLQAELEEYLGVPHVALYTNGHLALENAIAALNLPEGGEVITTPFTFASTTHAIVRNGLVPVFCDVNDKDYTMDVTKIEGLITDRTVAIVPVHVYGNICDVEAIETIAKKYGLKVIYDAAHAFAVKYKGMSTACFGDASMFSFHATKVFNTIEGGAVCFKDDSWVQLLNDQKNFGIHGPESVCFVGGNAKMNEFQAAMGICNLRHLDEEIAKRKKVVERYRERLSGVEGIKLSAIQENVESNYIKALSNISAYTEGYAVYAQYEALSYLDEVDQTLLEAYKENELATYCMIILADIGIHYDGWSVEEFKEFMESKGFSLDDESIRTQYAQLQANPAAFEPYYVGYHEIINMKEDAQQALGSRFHEKEFHTALLESGIAPFQVVQQHIDAYVEKNK